MAWIQQLLRQEKRSCLVNYSNVVTNIHPPKDMLGGSSQKHLDYECREAVVAQANEMAVVAQANEISSRRWWISKAVIDRKIGEQKKVHKLLRRGKGRGSWSSSHWTAFIVLYFMNMSNAKHTWSGLDHAPCPPDILSRWSLLSQNFSLLLSLEHHLRQCDGSRWDVVRLQHPSYHSINGIHVDGTGACIESPFSVWKTFQRQLQRSLSRHSSTGSSGLFVFQAKMEGISGRSDNQSLIREVWKNLNIYITILNK